MIIIIILKKRKYLFTQIKSLRIPQKSRGLKRIITISIMQMYTTRYTGGRQPYGRMSNSKQLVHPGELVNKAKESKAKQSKAKQKGQLSSRSGENRLLITELALGLHFGFPLGLGHVGAYKMVHAWAANVVVDCSTKHMVALVILVQPVEIGRATQKLEGL